MKQAATRISESVRAGHSVATVVSAMGAQTDTLLQLARSVNPNPPARELDALLATGEQASAALLCMALEEQGIRARSYTGWQLPIRTDGQHSSARIVAIDAEQVRTYIESGAVAVVTGFQGVDAHNNINTLGRGGSDTSAVALAVALNATECRIYTDVAGVYTADPRIVKNARVLKSILFEEMLELAGQGSKVLHPRAVEIAGRHQMPLRVLANTDSSAQGTLLKYNGDGKSGGVDSRNRRHVSLVHPADNQSKKGNDMEASWVSGISHDNNEAKINLVGAPDTPGVAARILGEVAQANIDVDMIVQSTGEDGTTNLGFTVARRDVGKAQALLEPTIQEMGTCSMRTDSHIAKISLVGIGMRGHAGVASKMFAALAERKINIEMISTSEIKVAVIIAEKHLKSAVKTLHDTFNLEKQ